MRTKIFACLAALLFAAPVVAADDDIVTIAEFSEQKQVIEKDLAGGERYSEIARKDKQEVLAALARMEDLLSDVKSVEELNTNQRIQLFNDQELVNTVLTDAAKDSRMVCSRAHRAGSHFKNTRCETVAQRRIRLEENQDALRRMQGRIRLPDNG